MILLQRSQTRHFLCACSFTSGDVRAYSIRRNEAIAVRLPAGNEHVLGIEESTEEMK